MQILKNVGAAVAGYVAMFAVAFVLFSIMWAILGSERAFQPATWDITGAWIVGSIGLGLLVSMAGGATASKLGDGKQSVAILVGLVLLMGVLAALPEASSGAPRPPEIGILDAMSQAKQPTWLLWLNPLFGVVGVLLGAKLASRSTSD
jgi:hypothetical protein